MTILTPSRWFNSQGLLMTPHLSRNTDGIDPGETSFATCGVMAHNTISTGDDHIALKGGHAVWNIIILHNHFGTGHGMSIGSETYGVYPAPEHRLSGVSNVRVCDLTIDADSRPVGNGASPGDFNGIRVKSDSSRGGVVDKVDLPATSACATSTTPSWSAPRTTRSSPVRTIPSSRRISFRTSTT